MRAFLNNMSLARLIILLAIPGSIYLAWAGFARSDQLETLRAAYKSRIPDMLREIQELAKLNTKLHKDIKGDIYISKDSPETYVRYCADNPAVSMGDVTTTRSSRPGAGGVIDNKITIRPQDSKKVFTHAQIAAFLYRLEAESNQIKVTDIEYTLLGRGIKNDAVPQDEWTWEATITNRIKDPSKSKPNRSGI